MEILSAVALGLSGLLLVGCIDDAETVIPDSGMSGDASASDGGGAPVCDVFSGAGCLASQKCSALQLGIDLVLGCASKGSKGQGAACTPVMSAGLQTGDDCAAGLACFSVAGEAAKTCRHFCTLNGTGPSCALGTTCGLVIKNSDLSVVGPFCSANATCQLLDQTPCGASDGCYVTSTGPQCAPSGAGQPGAACTKANDCVRGSSCLVTAGAGKCSFHCSTVAGGAPACAATGTGGTTCTALAGTAPQPGFGVCR